MGVILTALALAAIAFVSDKLSKPKAKPRRKSKSKKGRKKK